MMANSTSSDPSPEYSPLAAFAGLVGTLAVFLFFTGWIYRWSYFSFFQIDVNSLDLPTESFLIASIQVILADPIRLGWAFFIAFATIIAIKVTLWALDPSSNPEGGRASLLSGKIHRSIPLKVLRYFTNLFPTDLRKDLTITIWILIILFWFSTNQGQQDASRDFLEKTTTRPTITAILDEEKKVALAALLNTEAVDGGGAVDYPKLESRIFGDLQQFRYLYRQGVTIPEKSDANASSWRLLIENGNWIYTFQTISQKKDGLHPHVVALSIGEGPVQSVILGAPGKVQFVHQFTPT
jgi:hypothetical protein